MVHVRREFGASRIVVGELRQIGPDARANQECEMRRCGTDHLLQFGVARDGIQVFANSHRVNCRRSLPVATVVSLRRSPGHPSLR